MANQHTRPVTDEDRKAVRELHAEGLPRNEIARRLNRSGRTISAIAVDLGLTFDRAGTEAATRARAADAKARRADLIDRALTRAEALFDRLEAADVEGYRFTATTVRGIESETLDHVPGSEERALASAAGQYLAQAAKLEALDAGSGHDEDRGILAGIAHALGWQTPGGSTGEG